MSSKRIGFAGLGLMGSRMAARFLEPGYELSVWNRSVEKCAPLQAKGARVAASPRELAESADVVFSSLADPPAVERLVFAPDGVLQAARPGFRYVETSTISPDLSRRLIEAFRERGADALEAPVTGSKNGAAQGTLVLMTGGRRETHDELLPLLAVLGPKIIYCGEAGSAAVVKLVGNTIISFMLEGLCEGLVVARKAGLPFETLLEVIMASGYASPYFTFKGGAIARRDFEQHFSIDLLVKDQNLMLQEAHVRQAPMPGLAAIREVFQAARAQGHGQADIAAVVQVLERAAGL
jgi:3-hydroxyisobutyrate dehydrogenase-like beta-hydroxyacid dehydrogenase